MSIKGLFAVSAALAIFQMLIAVGLFVVAYSDTFGLEHIATNGEKIVQQLGQLEQRAGPPSGEPQSVGGGQLRTLLQANNHAFRQLGKLAAWIATALLLSALLQLGVAYILARPSATSNRASHPTIA
jgi:hypothetical protein